jgi:hypothetical protein
MFINMHDRGSDMFSFELYIVLGLCWLFSVICSVAYTFAFEDTGANASNSFLLSHFESFFRFILES